MGRPTTGTPKVSTNRCIGMLPPRVGRRTTGPTAPSTDVTRARANGVSISVRAEGEPAPPVSFTNFARAGRAAKDGVSVGDEKALAAKLALNDFLPRAGALFGTRRMSMTA